MAFVVVLSRPAALPELTEKGGKGPSLLARHIGGFRAPQVIEKGESCSNFRGGATAYT